MNQSWWFLLQSCAAFVVCVDEMNKQLIGGTLRWLWIRGCRRCRRCGRSREGRSCAFCRHIVAHLRVPSSPPRHGPSELDLFTDYMRRERGWSEAKVRYRRSRADELLRRFCRGKRTLADIAVTMIDQVLSEKSKVIPSSE